MKRAMSELGVWHIKRWPRTGSQHMLGITRWVVGIGTAMETTKGKWENILSTPSYPMQRVGTHMDIETHLLLMLHSGLEIVLLYFIC